MSENAENSTEEGQNVEDNSSSEIKNKIYSEKSNNTSVLVMNNKGSDNQPSKESKENNKTFDPVSKEDDFKDVTSKKQTTEKTVDDALKQETNIDESNLDYNLKHFVNTLSDAGKFSYLGLCSTVLTLLYFEDFEKEYRHKVVKSLVEHVNLPSNPTATMIALCDGHGSIDTDVFVESLLEETIMKEEPQCIAEDLVLWSLISSASKDSCGGRYDARTRILIRHITWRMHIQLEDLETIEEKMVKMLQEENSGKEADEQAQARSKNSRNRKWKSYAMIGLAAAGGGAIIGLTGGLAAPLVAAGAGAVLGASTAAALGSVAGIAIITSVFGAAGAGLTGYKMKRRVGGIDQFLFRPLTAGKQLAVTIAISGWLSSSTGEGDFTVPWLSLRQSDEQYCLVWETKHLLRLGGAFEYILDSLLSVAANEALKYTVLSGLLTAIAWPASLLAASSVIDNPWSVCLQRSVQVGKELAEVLLARQHGHRPVTLIGYSLGARVIYHCLEEMARRKNHSGIVEDVILLGAPVSGQAENWHKFAKVVAGHITNGYCKSDWLLRFLYRTSSAQSEVAGLGPVKWDDRRMINIDLSSLVEGHLDYRKRMPEILSAVGVRSKKDSVVMAKAMSGVKDKRCHSDPNLKAQKVAEKSIKSQRSHTADEISSILDKKSENECCVKIKEEAKTSLVQDNEDIKKEEIQSSKGAVLLEEQICEEKSDSYAEHKDTKTFWVEDSKENKKEENSETTKLLQEQDRVSEVNDSNDENKESSTISNEDGKETSCSNIDAMVTNAIECKDSTNLDNSLLSNQQEDKDKIVQENLINDNNHMASSQHNESNTLTNISECPNALSTHKELFTTDNQSAKNIKHTSNSCSSEVSENDEKISSNNDQNIS